PGDYATLTTPCPACGSVVKENYRRYACTNCDFSITKHPGGRTFEIPEVEELLQNRTLGPLSGFISKMGRPFSAILRITPENKLEFDFGQSDDDNSEPLDVSQLTPVGRCPKCSGNVYDTGMSYVCENSVSEKKTCDFKSGRVILQQEIDHAQMGKLLSQGKTDLLEGFVSNRTNRKFKAYLALSKAGKIEFEFEPRPAKTAKAASKSAAKAASKSAAKSAATAAEADSGKVVKKAAKKTARKTASKTATKKTAVKKAAAKKVAGKSATARKQTAKTADPDDTEPAF